jgi:hypothetical protein
VTHGIVSAARIVHEREDRGQWKTLLLSWGIHEDMLLHMKRTTLIIHTSLYLELKKRAAQEGRTLTDVVETALRLGLDGTQRKPRAHVPLPSYDLGPFLIDPTDRSGFGVALQHPELHTE